MKQNKREVGKKYQFKIENQKKQIEQLKEFKELFTENMEKQQKIREEIYRLEIQQDLNKKQAKAPNEGLLSSLKEEMRQLELEIQSLRNTDNETEVHNLNKMIDVSKQK